MESDCENNDGDAGEDVLETRFMTGGLEMGRNVIGNGEKEGDIPFREMMIHIKKAVKVMASGNIKRSTIQSGAF